MAIIKADDALSQLPQNLLAIMVNKQELEQRKEDLKIRQGEFKLRSEEAMRQQELQRAQMEGATAAAQFLAQQNPAFGEAAPTNPQALPSFMENLQGFRMGEAQIGNEELEGSLRADQVRVNAATRDARVDVANLQPEVLRQQLATSRAEEERLGAVTRGANLQNSYQAMMNQLGPEFTGKLAQARGLFETGAVTWGEARRTVGLPKVEGGVSDEAVFVDPSGGAAGGAEAIKNQGFARMMQISDGIINELEGSGVRLGLLPSIQRQTQSATLDAAINAIAAPEQQRLVTAQRMFGDAYRFSLSGQQSSDREALRMLNSISSQVGDDDATIAQKRVLREVMKNVTEMKAGGAISGVQGAQMGLRAAQNTGNPEIISVFEEILNQTIEYEGTTPSARPPSSVPADPSTLPGMLDDERLNRLLGIGG